MLYPTHLAQEAAAMAAVRNAAMASSAPIMMAPLGKPDAIDPLLGRHGGLTLKEVTTGGVKYPPGVYLPPELVMRWPLLNRSALAGARRVSYFQSPPDPEALKGMMQNEAALAASLLG